MQCPECNYEPRDKLLSSPCPNPNCSHIWFDTFDYVKLLADDLIVDTVLDVGCGTKGVIAQAYWEERGIKNGYACDRHVLKAMSPIWTPLLIDAECLSDYFQEGVDFVTHCGLMEHIDYEKAFRVFEVIEKIAKKGVFFTFSAFLRDVDYKVKLDGNPYHYYKSWWDARTIESLGYHIDRQRMSNKQTFTCEVTGWFYPKDIEMPFKERMEKAIESICNRRCSHQNCNREPIIWDAEVLDQDVYLCMRHYKEKCDATKEDAYLNLWLERTNIEEVFSYPPWRDKLPVL